MPRLLLLSVSVLHRGRDPRSIRAERLIAGLAERGFEVEVAGLWAGAGEPPGPVGASRIHPIAAPVDWEAAGAEQGPEAAEAAALAGWIGGVAPTIAELPEAERPDLIYAVGVPVSTLEAGAAVAEAVGRPLVADLGDPWTAASRAEQERRRRVLGAAAALVTTTPELGAELRPELAPRTPLLLSPAGGELRRRRERESGQPPLVVHLGAINAGRVEPRPAFAALGALARAGRIELRSHTTGWHPALGELGVEHLALLPHEQALELLATASAALVLGNEHPAQLPSKAYEIACTETWALCIGEREGEGARGVLEASGHAVVPTDNEEASITAAVEEILARESRGERPTPAAEQTWERRLDEIAALLAGVAP